MLPFLVSKLQSFVASERFLGNLDAGDLDDILDARDSDPFDAEWGRLYRLVSQRNRPNLPASEALRESVFERAFAITESSDACGYISDDFGLIAGANELGISDPWLSAMAVSYLSGYFPHGKLVGDSRSLAEIIIGLDQ